jgi:hypothetical protein
VRMRRAHASCACVRARVCQVVLLLASVTIVVVVGGEIS